jgi:hypothetical protein
VTETWQETKSRSDIFLPPIKRVLGEHLIGEPPIEEDAERNTDLMVLKLEAVRVGCRMRDLKYRDSYGHEITIRSGRPSGVKTELTKIIEGWGDYFFYGFGDFGTGEIRQWVLCDLKPFRIWFNRQLYSGKKDWEGKNNVDGSSSFIAVRYADVPGFVVASSMALCGACVSRDQDGGRPEGRVAYGSSQVATI